VAILSESRKSVKEMKRDRSILNMIPVLMRLAVFPYLSSEQNFEGNLTKEEEMPTSHMAISNIGSIRATLYNP